MEITYCTPGQAYISDVLKKVKPSPSSRWTAAPAGLAAIISVAVALALPLGETSQGHAAATGAATQPGQTKSPEQKGRERAAADIKAGTPRILYYGKPWSVGKPLIDEASRLRIEIVVGCCVTPEFVAETDAYNAAMRQWAKSRPAPSTSSRQATQPATGSGTSAVEPMFAPRNVKVSVPKQLPKELAKSDAFLAVLGGHEHARPNSVRMTWFLHGHLNVAMVCFIDLDSGQWATSREVYEWASQTHDTGRLDAAKLAEARKLAEALPPSADSVDPTFAVLVSAPADKQRSLRVYNRRQLPEPILKLHALAKAYIDTSDYDAIPPMGSAPSTRPALDMNETARMLARKMGGKWEVLPAGLGELPVVRGQVQVRHCTPAPFPVMRTATYQVLPLPYDGPARYRILRHTEGADQRSFEVLGYNAACTVLVDRNGQNDASPAVVKALELRPPGVSLNILRLRRIYAGNRSFRLTLVPRGSMKFDPVKLPISYNSILDEHDPLRAAANLTPGQAEAILDYMVDNGLIPEMSAEGSKDDGCVAVLGVFTHSWHCNLGADRRTLAHLQFIGAMLDETAGVAVAKVISQLKAAGVGDANTERVVRAKLLVKEIQDQAERELIDALVRAIKRDLPADWSVAQVRHGEVEPRQWPAGQGWEIRTLRSGYKPEDMKRGISVEGRLWIMDSDYVAAARPNVGAGKAQTSPARELPSWHGRGVFESGETYAAKALQETRTADDVRKQWAALMARYKNKDERYWNDSIRELDQWTDDRIIPEMVADFRNKNVDAHLRRSTLIILGRMDDRKAIPIMVEAAKDSDAEIRSYAVASLGRKGGPEAFGVIEAALKDANENVRHTAIVAMGALRDNRSLDVLLKLLEDPNDLTRRFVAEGLGELGDQRARPNLAAAMKDKSELVRRFAVLALARLGDPMVLDRLISALTTDVDGLHGWAPWALGQLGDKRAVEPLFAAMKDQDVNMRVQAVRALGKLNDRRAVEPLLAALKDADSTIRLSAAESLGELGEPRAIEALKPLLSDNNDSVCAAALNALKKLQQAAPKPATQPATAPAPSAGSGQATQPAALDEKAARALAARLANEAFARQTFKRPNGKPVGKIEIAPESFNDVSRTVGRWVLRMVRPAGPEAFVDFAADGSDPKVVVNFAWR